VLKKKENLMDFIILGVQVVVALIPKTEKRKVSPYIDYVKNKYILYRKCRLDLWAAQKDFVFVTSN